MVPEMVLQMRHVWTIRGRPGAQTECGIPFWPHAFLTVQGDIEKLLQNWNNEYGLMAYGEEIYDTIIDFCELMDIKVILP